MRRIVLTKDEISFAFVGGDSRIDYIPFAEVLQVKEMKEAARDNFDGLKDTRFSNVLQISTISDGYNSGRTYYLSSDSKETLDSLIEFMSKKADAARTQVEARTFSRKVQRSVRIRYESQEFQSVMAILIAAVRAGLGGQTPFSTLDMHADYLPLLMNSIKPLCCRCILRRWRARERQAKPRA